MGGRYCQYRNETLRSPVSVAGALLWAECVERSLILVAHEPNRSEPAEQACRTRRIFTGAPASPRGPGSPTSPARADRSWLSRSARLAGRTRRTLGARRSGDAGFAAWTCRSLWVHLLLAYPDGPGDPGGPSWP